MNYPSRQSYELVRTACKNYMNKVLKPRKLLKISLSLIRQHNTLSTFKEGGRQLKQASERSSSMPQDDARKDHDDRPRAVTKVWPSASHVSHATAGDRPHATIVPYSGHHFSLYSVFLLLVFFS